MKYVFSLLFSLFLVLNMQGQQGKRWSLQECVSYAKEHNIDVKKSELGTNISKIEVDRAKTNFYPAVSANVGGNFNFGTPDVNESFGNNLGLSSGATLYNGKRNKNAVKLAENDLEISQLQTEQIKDNITLQVINAYLNVLYNRESVTIAEDQVNVGKLLLERMGKLVEAGTKAANDLYQVEANLAQNEEGLVSAKNNLEIALLDLSQLLQISSRGFDVEEVSIDIESAYMLYKNSDIIYEKAINMRPEIISAQKRIDNADTSIEIAKAGKLPVINASYGFNTGYSYYFGSSLSPVQQQINGMDYFKQLDKGRGHSLGVSVNIPIFDKFETKNSVQRAKIQREIANYTLEDEKTILQAKIERAYIDAKTSLKKFEAAKKSVEAQKEAFRTAKERYNLGVMTSFDFEQVRNQLAQAQSAFIRAKYNYVFRTKFLDYYYGLPIKL